MLLAWEIKKIIHKWPLSSDGLCLLAKTQSFPWTKLIFSLGVTTLACHIDLRVLSATSTSVLALIAVASLWRNRDKACRVSSASFTNTISCQCASLSGNPLTLSYDSFIWFGHWEKSKYRESINIWQWFTSVICFTTSLTTWSNLWFIQWMEVRLRLIFLCRSIAAPLYQSYQLQSQQAASTACLQRCPINQGFAFGC